MGSLTRFVNRGLFLAKKNADKIEMVAGGVCVVTGTGFLIHDAEKISDAQRDILTRINYIKEADAQPDGEGWADKAERTAYVKETIKIAVTGMAKGCWKGVTLIAVGEFLQCLSHATLSKKYQIANTALAGTTLAFNNYRQRVVEDQGKEKDYQYLTGDGTMVAVEQKEDGTVTTTEVPLHTMGDSRAYIPHSFFLGDVKNFYLTSGNNGNVARGIDDLLRGLKYANDKAKFRGMIFENEIRSALDINPTVAGQAAGMYFEEKDGSTNRVSLFSHGVEIGDPSLLEGKPEDLLFEIKVINTAKDGTTKIKPIDDNILNRITDVDPVSKIPLFGWQKV